MKRASIDIGSNSVLLLACEVSESGTIEKVLLNESSITSLGKDLDKNKTFHSDSMKATYEALKTYKALLEKMNFSVKDVIMTATEASRVALNAREFYAEIKRDLGFEVQIISGEGEAYYTALGVVSSLGDVKKDIVIMDMGGASTELIKVQTSPFKINSSISLPVGSVRATDWKKNGEFEFKMNQILNYNLDDYTSSVLVCVAGSMTSLASMFRGKQEYSDEAIEGMDISFSSFLPFAHDLRNTSIENLLLLFPFLAKRAPMIGAASHVAELIGNKLKIDTIKISTRGLRYGTIICGGIDGQFIRS